MNPGALALYPAAMDTEPLFRARPGAITGLFSPAERRVVLHLARIRHPIVWIGRDERSTLYLDDYSVSAAHCTLSKGDGVWTVRDHGSTNGTLLNGTPVTAPVALKPGDRLDLGRVVLYAVDATLRIPLPATSNTSLQVHQADVYGPTQAGRVFGRTRQCYYKAAERYDAGRKP